jgi:hypothetical protein
MSDDEPDSAHTDSIGKGLFNASKSWILTMSQDLNANSK